MDDEQEEMLELATWLKDIGDEANNQHQNDNDIATPFLAYQAFYLSCLVSIIFLFN